MDAFPLNPLFQPLFQNNDKIVDKNNRNISNNDDIIESNSVGNMNNDIRSNKDNNYDNSYNSNNNTKYFNVNKEVEYIENSYFYSLLSASIESAVLFKLPKTITETLLNAVNNGYNCNAYFQVCNSVIV